MVAPVEDADTDLRDALMDAVEHDVLRTLRPALLVDVDRVDEQHADEVGLDVFATGEHHNPPFVAPANPTVLLAHLAAVTRRIILTLSLIPI